jgi:ElaA protein
MNQKTRIIWQWCRLEQLSAEQLYVLCAARESVFVVEQHCAYQELDGRDSEALHLIAWSGNEVAAYLRVLAPGAVVKQPSIGRVMTAKFCRGRGLGREIMTRALDYLDEVYPEEGVGVSAQTYLERFYGSFGFEPVSEPYLEDGIPHIKMVREKGDEEKKGNPFKELPRRE